MPSVRHHQDSVRRCKIPNGQIVTQWNGHNLGRKKKAADMEFSPPRRKRNGAGFYWRDGGMVCTPGFAWLLFPFLHRARRFFSFSKKRKKRMGAQKHYIICPQKSVECWNRSCWKAFDGCFTKIAVDNVINYSDVPVERKALRNQIKSEFST